MCTLTEDEMNTITEAIIEECGTDLEEEILLEAIGIILESVSGLECLAIEHIERLIIDTKGRYYAAVREIKNSRKTNQPSKSQRVYRHR